MAIDPGPHCGVAVRTSDGILITGTFLGHEEVLQGILDYDPDTVVIERFATAGRISKDGLYTVALVGMVEALCWLKDIRLVKMTPGSRRAFMADAKRQHQVAKGPHELDALAHLLSYEHRREKGYIK